MTEYTANIIASLLHSEQNIARTPHVLLLDSDDILWQDVLPPLVDDLIACLTPEEWIPELLHEGNIALAEQLLRHANLNATMQTTIIEQEETWKDVVDTAINEAIQFLQQEQDEATLSEIEQFNIVVAQARHFVERRRYGDAITTIQRAQQAIEDSIKRRQEILIAKFKEVDEQLRAVKQVLISVKRLPGGEQRLNVARAITIKADELLTYRDFEQALTILRWAQEMIEGREVPDEVITQVLRVDSSQTKPVDESLFLAVREEQSQDREGHQWTFQEDEYLIAHYDVADVLQLCHHLGVSEEELYERMEYHGLDYKRDTTKPRSKPRNPYVAGKPIRSGRIFVGRTDVFEFVRDTLQISPDEEQADRNIIALVGHRRTGKTSLLLQLKHNRSDILAPRLPVFIDMESILKIPSLQRLFYKMASTIYEDLTERGFHMPEPVEEQFRDPDWQFRRFLVEAKRAIGGRGIVLMIDEFQALEARVFKGQMDVDVYKMLRSVIQHDAEIDFILAGTMQMERMMREYQAAMFGSLVIRKIDFLEEQAARNLIVAPVSPFITYTREAQDRIIELTASHPYFVQLVCFELVRYLFERGKSMVYSADVERIVPKVLEGGGYFEGVWATDTSELELYMLAIMGEMFGPGQSWCRIRDIETRLQQSDGLLRGVESTVGEAIDNLLHRQILTRNEDGTALRFQVALFGLWVAQNKPLVVVRRNVLTQEAQQRKRIELQPKNA